MRFFSSVATFGGAFFISSIAMAQAPAPTVQQCLDLVKASKFSEADSVCTQASKDDPMGGALLNGQYLHLYKKDPRAALVEYQKVRRTLKDGEQPNDVQLAALRGVALVVLEMNGGLDAARTYLKYAPDDVQVLSAAAERDTLRWGGDPTFADKLIALNPRDWQPHVLRSRTLLARGKFAEALVSAQAAATLAPKEPIALMQRGDAYAANQKYPEAVRDYAATSVLAPNEPRIHVSRGIALLKADRAPEAIEAASTALKINPGLPEALELRVGAHLRMGDGERALADVAAGQKLKPGREWSSMAAAAETIVFVQRTITARTATDVSADTAAVIEAFQGHLQSTCGHYSQGAGQAWLDQFSACSKQWRSGEALKNQLPAGAEAPAKRLADVQRALRNADGFSCATMPAKSRCLDPQWISQTRVQIAVLEGRDDMLRLARNAEVQRINRGVESNNASIRLQNRAVGFANFMTAVADALADQ